jgi:hypothetical protein
LGNKNNIRKEFRNMKKQKYDDYDLSPEEQRKLSQNFETLVQTGDISNPICCEEDGIAPAWLTEDAVDGELADLINAQIETEGEEKFFSSGKSLTEFQNAMNTAIQGLDQDENVTKVKETTITTEVEISSAGNVQVNQSEETIKTVISVPDEEPQIRGLFVSMDYKRELCTVSDGIQFMTISLEDLPEIEDEQTILVEQPMIISLIVKAAIANLYPTAQFTRSQFMQEIGFIIDDCDINKFVMFTSETDDDIINAYYAHPSINAELDDAIDHFKKTDQAIAFATALYKASLTGGYQNQSRRNLDPDDDLRDKYQETLLSDSDTMYKDVPDVLDDGESIPFVHNIKRIWKTLMDECDEFVDLINDNQNDDYDPEEEEDDTEEEDNWDDDPEEEEENEDGQIDIFAEQQESEEEPCSEIKIEVTETKSTRITLPDAPGDIENYKITPGSGK